jgi:hypothetical protein
MHLLFIAQKDSAELSNLEEMFLINNYYFVVNKGKEKNNLIAKKLDKYESLRMVSQLKRSDLILLGDRKTKLSPPYFSFTVNNEVATLVEYITESKETKDRASELLFMSDYIFFKRKDINRIIIPLNIGCIHRGFNVNFNLKDNTSIINR